MSEEKFQELLKQADALLSAGNFSEALKLYEEALNLYPGNQVVVRNIANIYLKLGEFSSGIGGYIKYAVMLQDTDNAEESEKIYKELLGFLEAGSKISFIDKNILSSSAEEIKGAVSQYFSLIIVNLAHIYMRGKSVEDAAALCLKALERAPQEADIRIMLGSLYAAAGKLTEAVGEFQEVIKLAPQKSAAAYECLGDVLSKDKKRSNEAASNYINAATLYRKDEYFEKEIEVYNKILAVEPSNVRALMGLSDAFFKRGDTESGLKILYGLIELYEKEGLIDRVILVYEKIYEIDKENAAISEKLAAIYKEILENDPYNLSASHKLAAHLVSLGKIDEAIPVFINLAVSYMENNLIDEGITICGNILQISADIPRVYELLGTLYSKKRADDEAMSAYVKAFEIYRRQGEEKKANGVSEILQKKFPNKNVIHYELALSFLEKNELEKAEEEITRAMQVNPKDINAMKLYVNLLRQQGRADELIGVYQKILQVEPADVAVREHLIESYLNLGRIEDAVKESKYLGDVLFENKEYAAAEKLFRNILSFFPDDIDVRERIAQMLLRRNEIKKAKKELLVLLDYHIKNKYVNKALDICRKIIKVDPQDFNAYHVLGRLAHRNGMAKEALSCFMFLADLYLLNKINHKAMETLFELLRISSKQTRYRRALVGLLLQEGKPEEAVQHYKILIRDLIEEQNISKAVEAAKDLTDLLPEDYLIRRELSIIFIKSGLVKEGLEILEGLLSLQEGNADYNGAIEISSSILDLLHANGFFKRYWDLRLRKPSWYNALGNYESAAAESFEIISGMARQNFIDEVRGILPEFIARIKENNFTHYFDRLQDAARRMHLEGLFDGAITVFNFIGDYYRERNQYQALVSMYDMTVSGYLQLGNDAEALHTYKKIVEVYNLMGDKDKALDANFNIIELLVKMRRYEEIDSLYNDIERLSGPSPEIKRRMANVYFNVSNYEKARQLLEDLAESIENDPEALSKLAIIYINTGLYEKAVPYAKKAVHFGNFYVIVDELKSKLKQKFIKTDQNIILAAWYKDLSFYEDALQCLFACFKENPEFAVRKLIAEYLAQYQCIDLAVKQYKQILDTNLKEEDYLTVKYDLARLYEFIDKRQEALENYQDCLAIDIKYKDVASKVRDFGG